MFRTCTFVRLGLHPKRRAAKPAAWGDAIDVPLAYAYEVEVPFHADCTLTPGAASSTLAPVLEKQGLISLLSVAATAITSGKRAGYSTLSLAPTQSPELPAAAK